MILINPCTWARDKVIGSVVVVVVVVVVVSTKIAKSRKPGVGQSAQCHQTVKIPLFPRRSGTRLMVETIFHLLQIAYDGPRALQIVCFHRPHLSTTPINAICWFHCTCSISEQVVIIDKVTTGVLHYFIHRARQALPLLQQQCHHDALGMCSREFLFLLWYSNTLYKNTCTCAKDENESMFVMLPVCTWISF